MTLHSDTAAKCIILNDKLAFIGLLLTFGGKPCPAEWCFRSELTMDLANDILHAPQQDPLELASPHTAMILEPIL